MARHFGRVDPQEPDALAPAPKRVAIYCAAGTSERGCLRSVCDCAGQQGREAKRDGEHAFLDGGADTSHIRVAFVLAMFYCVARGVAEWIMDIEGKWFVQPGDIPADFVFPLVLHSGGRAEWPGKHVLVEPYRIGGGVLSIGEGCRRIVVKLPDDEEAPRFLLGDMLSEYEPDEDEEEDGSLPILRDAVTLLRDPGDLELVDYSRGEETVPKHDETPFLF
jgi:hypothetical protein